MSLCYDTYAREPCGGFHSVATGQRLLIARARRDRLRCTYRDADTSLEIDINLLGSKSVHGQTALLDWNGPSLSEASKVYGLWRRTTWFLLDALLVWLIEEKRPQQTVLSLGGWFNGAWRTRGRLQSSWYDGGTRRDKLAEPVLPYAVYPLEATAPRWRYEPGAQGAVEGRIAVVEANGRQQADLSRSIAEQLSNVPRFVAEDGTIYFFHRVMPFGGPEYSPTVRHGLATPDFAWYFFQHGGIDGEPIALRPDADLAQPLIRQVVDGWRLHPSLREAQFFAGAEASALSFATPYDALPQMRALERDVGLPFHVGVDRISAPPMSVGLPPTQLASWPRLSTEADELVRDPVAKRRELQRARGLRMFLKWREGHAADGSASKLS